MSLAAGPSIAIRELIELVARHVGRRPLLLPVPFPAWQVLALITRNSCRVRRSRGTRWS